MTYIKNPEYVTAFHVNAETRSGICRWINGEFDGSISQRSSSSYITAWFYESNGDSEFYLDTGQGTVVVTALDTVYQVHGEKQFRVMPRKDFDQKYNLV